MKTLLITAAVLTYLALSCGSWMPVLLAVVH